MSIIHSSGVVMIVILYDVHYVLIGILCAHYDKSPLCIHLQPEQLGFIIKTNKFTSHSTPS